MILAVRGALLPLLALGGACEPFESDFAVGTLERDRIELTAELNEPIVTINVTEGDRVEAGAALLLQDATRAAALLAQARAERDGALAALSEAETGPRRQAIEGARARLAGAESAVATTQRELDREISLNRQNYASESRVNMLRGDLETATARREEITAELAELLEGTRSEEIQRARAALRAADAAVTELEITLARATIRAPVSGIVESLPFELGERPVPGQITVVLLADGSTYARVHVPEPLRTRLMSGLPAAVRIDGYPDDFPGRIRWIAADASFTPYFALTQHDRSRLSYLAEVDLVDPPELPTGIPVEVRFPTLAQ